MNLDPQKMIDDIQQVSERKPTVKAAPMVRKMAAKDGVDLSKVSGSGKNGCITKADYEAYTGQEMNVVVEPSPSGVMNHMTDEAEIGELQFRREGGAMDHSMKKTLHIPEKYKNPNLHYHFVNDEGGRVEKLRELGYQVVDSKHLTQDETISVRRRVGTQKDGSPLYAVLMATPKDWRKQRHQKAEERRHAHEKGMFQTPQDEHGKALGSEFYAREESGYRDSL